VERTWGVISRHRQLNDLRTFACPGVDLHFMMGLDDFDAGFWDLLQL
jgi:hypothetical protein